MTKKLEMLKALHDQHPNNSAASIQTALEGFTVARNTYGDGVVTAGGTYNLLYCPTSNRQYYGVAAWNKSGQGYAIIDGSVQEIPHSPAGYATTCPRVNPEWSGSSQRWLHTLGEWASYI